MNWQSKLRMCILNNKQMILGEHTLVALQAGALQLEKDFVCSEYHQPQIRSGRLKIKQSERNGIPVKQHTENLLTLKGVKQCEQEQRLAGRNFEQEEQQTHPSSSSSSHWDGWWMSSWWDKSWQWTGRSIHAGSFFSVWATPMIYCKGTSERRVETPTSHKPHSSSCTSGCFTANIVQVKTLAFCL